MIIIPHQYRFSKQASPASEEISMLQQLEQFFSEFKKSLENENKKAEVLNLKALYVGKKGHFSEILKTLKDASPEEKKSIGAAANKYKILVEEMVEKKLEQLELTEINSRLTQNWVDLQLREANLDKGLQKGGYHPVTLVQREIEDIFISMGFEVLDGPHVEDEYHNFEALNIPGDHPARDMQDTFWFKDGQHLLRTHTSTIQIRGMKDRKPPFQFVGPGKVFRCERTDASHEMVFHQLEGMMVRKDLAVSHLIFFMKVLLKEIFKKEMEIRLRPGFFPFVEPGFELDIRCLICEGKGCSVCKKVGWLELLPCGMVHPNVLSGGGIDPKIYQGFAFGLGLDRLVMMRYGIEDVRHIHSGDLRFVGQFASF